MREHKLELLAPAGSFESLKAAISNGADAIYLGGGKHNARVNAANFTEEELVAALDYAHERGKKVYITLNTLIKNYELNDVLRFAEYIYKEGADAVIVQDLGLIKLLREYLPDLCIHASTQMTLANSEAVKSVEKMGVKKICAAQGINPRRNQDNKRGNLCRAGSVCSWSALCMLFGTMSDVLLYRRKERQPGIVCAQPYRVTLVIITGWQGIRQFFISNQSQRFDGNRSSASA